MINMDLNGSLYHSDLQSFGFIPRTCGARTAGSHDIHGINFLRGLHADFHMTIPISIPIVCVEGFLFPASSLAAVFCLDDSHSLECNRISAYF